MNYYNDNDRKKTAWLRALIADGIIPAGDVDERPIQEVHASDLIGYTQHHFFAGIGGWSLAFQLANIGEDEEAASCSCPCQPFSQTGKRLGNADPRHLFPQFHRLAREARFPRVFGEQVASKDGRIWVERVRAEMEDLGYTFEWVDLCAAGVSAPQLRQRIYWVAYANSARPQGRNLDWNRRCQWSPWANGVGVRGSSGRTRRIEPGIFPVANGFSDRVAVIEAAGDAIVAVLASEFIQSCEEAHQLEQLGI